jgi:transposase
MPKRKPYPSDVSAEEWAFVAPYLTLLVFNALRWIVRARASWRMLPHDFPPWEAVYQQTRRWIAVGVFEAMVHDLRALLRLGEGRNKEPTAAILEAAHCAHRPRVGIEPATMALSARRDLRCMQLWTPWDTCSPCT